MCHCVCCASYPCLPNHVLCLCIANNVIILIHQVDDTYCEPEYLASADEIATAMDSNRSSTTRSATLNTLCTPCFEHVQSIEGQYKASLGYENGEGNLCTRAGDTFCLPVLDDIEDTAAAEPTGGAINRNEIRGSGERKSQRRVTDRGRKVKARAL